MKYFVFYDEQNNFNDILNDSCVKKNVTFQFQWSQHLLLSFNKKAKEADLNLIVLKYGDTMKKLDIPDRSPIPFVDYIPIKTSN